MGRINPLIAVGIPTWGRVSMQWARAYRHIGFPLGSTSMEMPLENRPIAEARNTLMQQAIQAGCAFLFFVGDDVLPPGDAVVRLVQRMWENPDVHLATGVYWTKAWPTHPYLWRDMQRGPYLDWKVGEWLTVENAGCDCLLIRLSPEIKALGPDWFSTTWYWEPEQTGPSELATEDFYFYTRCREAGLKLWVDTNVQCIHEDRESGMLFGLLNDMRQAGGTHPPLPESGIEEGVVVIADIGCGGEAPFFGEYGQVRVIRLDQNEKLQPDYRCDVRKLPLLDQSVDVAHARHVLEHFGRAEAPAILKEWARIVRVGGELRLSVPNLLHACQSILDIEEGRVEPDHYPWWQLYGRQDDEHDRHFNGFTPRRLRKLLEMVDGLEDIAVDVTNEGLNLTARAKKARHAGPYILAAGWDNIERQEGIVVPGLRPVETVEEPARETEPAEHVNLAWLAPDSDGHGEAASEREELADELRNLPCIAVGGGG